MLNIKERDRQAKEPSKTVGVEAEGRPRCTADGSLERVECKAGPEPVVGACCSWPCEAQPPACRREATNRFLDELMSREG